MNNASPFQSQNPYGTAPAASAPTTLVANTLATHLSPFGHGRQAAPVASTGTLRFRQSV